MSADNLERIFEILFDSDSEEEFHGFTNDDIAALDQEIAADSDSEDEVECTTTPRGEIDSAYDISWLPDCQATPAPLQVPDNVFEADVFRLFISDDVLDLMVTETNRYALQVKEKKGSEAGVFSRVSQWEPVTRPEMSAFVGVLLLYGLTGRPSHELNWTTDPYLEMPGFRKIMSRNRFLSILSFFHLNDNETTKSKSDLTYDKLHKVRPFVDQVVTSWQRHFSPGREIAVDESMVAFKGRTELKTYMPSKPSKWGMKAWALADSSTGYMWNWKLYQGKENVPREHGVAHDVVCSLTQPLFGKGHIAYMDNFFSSPALFQELEQCGTGACGTLRTNRQGVPDSIKKAKPTSGHPPITERQDRTLYIAWQDKRQVNLMTNVHTSQTFVKEVRSKHHPNKKRFVEKPAAIEAYTKHMGGVDRADRQLSNYLNTHRSGKWWKKLFFYLFEVSFCNALVIWKHKTGGARAIAEKFRLQIAHGFIAGYRGASSTHRGRMAADTPPDRLLKEAHYPGINTIRLPSGRISSPDCVVCSNRATKRHQTQYICKTCQLPMCMYPCFERYHTLLDYKIPCNPNLHTE